MTRLRWLIAIAVVVVIAILVLRPDDEPTLLEQARELRSIDPYPFGKLEFSGWSGPESNAAGATITATYDAADASFVMTVTKGAAAAREEMLAAKRDLAQWDEVQQINTYAPSEYCAQRKKVVRCLAYVPDEPVFVESRVVLGDPLDDFDALGLLRTARKHWFRV